MRGVKLEEIFLALGLGLVLRCETKVEANSENTDTLNLTFVHQEHLP